ncbi:MAG: hypothetical protein KKA07_16040, partial [Bacteroidetes bacterium]|nr:hypothetical protein [Bacteroidota bacterium]
MNQLISIFMKQASCLTMMMFLVFSISIVQAQTKAGKMIDDGKFDDAEEYLIKKLEKDPNAVDLLFDRAKLYSNEGYAKFDIEKSYGYIKRSEQYFKKVKEEKDLKDLEKSGITSGTIGLMLDQINGKAYSEVAKKNNIATYNNFIKVHPETKQYVNQAIAERNKLAYQDAVSENTCLAYDDFMRYYPDAVQVPEAKKKYDDLFAKFLPEYTEAVKDGEMSTLQKFLFKNQAFPRTDSLFRKDYLLAQEAVDIGLSERLAYSPFESVGESGQQDDELNKRLKREGAKSGDIQISLMWDNFNDLDLHVREPSGEEMTFEHKKSATRGELDVDMNNYYGGEDENEAMNDSENSRKASTSPVENIYWPENEAPNGNFRVWVKYFLNYKFAIEYLDTAERLIHVNDPTNFSVRVSVNGKAKSFSNHTTYVPEILRKHIFAFDYYSHLLLPVEWTGKMKSRYDAYIKSAAPRELSYVAVQRLMSFPLIEKKFEEALDVIKKYEGHFASSEELSARIIGLKQIIERHDPGITVESLGKAINSAGAEYSPVISADDQLLYFCGNDRIGSLGKEDIWVAKREYSPLEIIGTDTIVDNVGHWGTAALLPVLNTKDGNEAPLSVSVDGNVLMLFSGGDIFYSERTKTGWSELQKFPAPINTEFWEGDAMLSSDGNSIIFVSNRPGGMNKNIDQNFYHGDLTFASDIYVCTRTGEKWSDPVNLGKTINTAFSERSPFLHPDMKTLYF